MSVWIIDDDPAILNLLSIALSQAGLDSRAFPSVGAALRALDEGSAPPGICLADWSLNDGPVLRVRSAMPDTQFVIMSGDPHAEEGLSNDIYWLSKPFRLADLKEILLSLER